MKKFIPFKEFLEKAKISRQRFNQLAHGYTRTDKRKDKVYKYKVEPTLKEGEDFKYNRTRLFVNKKLLKRFNK